MLLNGLAGLFAASKHTRNGIRSLIGREQLSVLSLIDTESSYLSVCSQSRQNGATEALMAAPAKRCKSTGTPWATSQAAMSSRDEAEIHKFAAAAEDWWDKSGQFAPLHAMNPVRCRFIRGALCDSFGLDSNQASPLAGLSVLDVGCGGGLLSESLARLGATVTGIDPAPENVIKARLHAAKDPDLAGRVTYRGETAEQVLEAGEVFDAVVASEVIEHVNAPKDFCETLAGLTKPGGAVVVSTLNRTPRSYALAIVGAEYIARMVPQGTHDWGRFVTPEELVLLFSNTGMDLEQIAGMIYNPLSGKWSLSEDVAVNYIGYFRKVPIT